MCAENSKRFHSSQMDQVFAKNAKIGGYVLQMEKSRNDRHQSPEYWLGFLEIIFGLTCI